MGATDLDGLFNDRSRFLITAHRGASFEFPENTVLAIRKAVEAGADMVEFDLRGTADNVPVLLHDATIDRTSNGHGKPEKYTLAELKKFNFSYYIHGQRRLTPVYEHMEIPTFEEILKEFRGKIAMNIHVYVSDALLPEVCRLFKAYDMYKWAYLTIHPARIPKIRAIDPDIEICPVRAKELRSTPEVLKKNKEEDKCRFVQPVSGYTGAKEFKMIRELGLRGNVFFVDTPEKMHKFKAMGAEGILTNKPHLMCQNRP